MKPIVGLAIVIIVMGAFHTGCSSPVSTGPGEIVTYHIGFSIQSQSRVTISIENSYQTGIRTVLDQDLSAGVYQVPVDMTDSSGNPLPEGLYLLRIVTDEYTDSHIMVLAYQWGPV